MGSFLQACCITNQSIQENETVYVTPIIENKKVVALNNTTIVDGLNESCYNTDMFKPLGFIFIGHYNDYGRYQIDWDRKENIIMFFEYVDFLNRNSVAVEPGDNKYPDVPFAPSLLNVDETFTDYDTLWEYIHNVIWEGRLFIKDQTATSDTNLINIYCKLHYHVSIKSHSDLLIDMYDNREEKRFYNVTEKQLKFLKLSIKDQAAFYSNLLFNYINDSDFNKLEFMEDFQQDKIGCFFRDCTSVVYGWNSWDLIRILKDKPNIAVIDIEKLYVLLHNFKSLTTAMSLCNLIYRPVHYGSQDYGNSLGNRFAYLMSKVNEHNIKERLQCDWHEEEYTEDTVVELLKIEAKNFDY